MSNNNGRKGVALTYIWSGFFLVGFVAALAQWLFLGDADVFKRIVDGTFESARVGVMDIALPLAGVMTLWLGILAVGEKAGAIDAVARIIAPVLLAHLPRRAARPSGHGPHGDELLGQLPRPGQRRHPVRPQGDGEPADAQPEARTRPPTPRSCSWCCRPPA